MIENIKARFAAKRFNIWTENIDPNRKRDSFFSGDFYANGKIWYGNPWWLFSESAQNSWFKDSEARKKLLGQ